MNRAGGAATADRSTEQPRMMLGWSSGTRNRLRRRARLIPGWLLLAFLAVLCLYPLVYIVFTSFKTQAEYASAPLAPPSALHVDNLIDLLGQFLQPIQSTGVLVVLSIGLILLVASMAGYAIAHLRFRFRRVVLFVIVFMMVQPPALLALPLYLTLNGIGLLDTHIGMVLLYTATVAPFSTYMLYSFFLGINHEIFEAAAVDGASAYRIFWSIVLPLSRSALVALVALLFFFVWNEAVLSVMVLQSTDVRTFSVGLLLLLDSFRGTIDIPLVASGMLISILPPLLVFALLQRSLVRGLSLGAVK